MTLEYKRHVRKPFYVEAVLITEDNIAEVAAIVGELKTEPDGTPYIQLDKKKVTNGFRVYVGYYMTRMGKQVRCYTPKRFAKEFREEVPSGDHPTAESG